MILKSYVYLLLFLVFSDLQVFLFFLLFGYLLIDFIDKVALLVQMKTDWIHRKLLYFLWHWEPVIQS